MNQKHALVFACSFFALFLASTALLTDRCWATVTPSQAPAAESPNLPADDADELSDSSRAALRALLERTIPGNGIRLTDVNRAPAVVGPPIYAETQEINPEEEAAVDITATSSSAAMTAREREKEESNDGDRAIPAPFQPSPKPDEESDSSSQDVIADPN